MMTNYFAMPDSTVSLLGAYLLWNVIVFFLYGIDKGKAKRGKWRISENTLILSAVLMGGVGALIGMKVFHHKTKHAKFRIGVPVAVVLNIVIAYIVINFLS